MRYRTILMDPPWPEHGGGKIKRGADRHYKLASVDAIPRIVYSSGLFEPEDSAHLYIWATNNYLEPAIGLFRSFGFRYVTKTTWVKMSDKTVAELLRKIGERDHAGGALGHLVEVLADRVSVIELAEAALQIGLGQYIRGADEVLLFGTRGAARVPAPVHRLPSVVFAPRGEHSAKPPVFHERIERVSAGPYLELFARSKREGWTVWGNEV